MARGLVVLLLYRLLRRRRYRSTRAIQFDAANPPRRMRWRPRLKLYGLVSGLVGGVGGVVLLAQYGIAPVSSRALSTQGLLGATFSGLVVPSAIFALVVWRFNRRLARLGGGGRPFSRRPAAATAVLVGGAVAAILLLATTRPAAAEVNGPCTATFAGVDAAGRTTSAGDAIEVPEDGAVNYAMAAPEDLQTWRFWLQYGPYSQLIAEGDKDAPNPNDRGLGLRPEDDFVVDFTSALGAPVVDGNTITGGVLTSEYAWMGAGLYEVHGRVTTVSGTSCDGRLLIDVAGNPLATVLGAAAAGAAAIGAAGAGAVAAGGLRDGGEVLDALDRFDPAEADTAGPAESVDETPDGGEGPAPRRPGSGFESMADLEAWRRQQFERGAELAGELLPHAVGLERQGERSALGTLWDDLWGAEDEPPPTFDEVAASGDADAAALQALLDEVGDGTPTADQAARMDELVWLINDRLGSGRMEVVFDQYDAQGMAAAGQYGALLTSETAKVGLTAGAGAAGLGGRALAGARFASGAMIDAARNIDKGPTGALAHGTLGGLTNMAGAAADDLAQGLSLGRRTLTGMVTGGTLAGAQDAAGQLIDSGGDTSQVDLTQTAVSTGVGVLGGGGGAALGGALDSADAAAGAGARAAGGADLPSASGLDLPSGTGGPDLPSGSGVDLPSGAGVDLPSGSGVDAPSGAGVDLPSGSGVDAPSSAEVDLPSGPSPSASAGAASPTPQELLEQGRPTASSDEILGRVADHRPGAWDPLLEGQPSGPTGRLPGQDVNGDVWAGGRQIGRMGPDGPVDLHGNPMTVAVDDMGGQPIGYFEQPTDVPDGMQPVYGRDGSLVGHVDQQGRAVVDGQLQPVAVGPDGTFVPHEPAPRAIPPEWGTEVQPGPSRNAATNAGVPDDAAGTVAAPQGDAAAPPARIGPYGEVLPAGDGLGAATPDVTDTAPRIPVLDADGQPTHLVEPGPRLVRPDADGNLVYEQTQYPTAADHPRMRDVPLDPDFPRDRLGQMPAPDRYAAATRSAPIGGDAAPVRLDANGQRPRGVAAALWDELGVPPGGRVDGVGTIDANGIIRTDDGRVVAGQLVNRRTAEVVGVVDAAGNVRAPDGASADWLGADFVPEVTVRDGRVVAYTTVDGSRVELGGGS